MTDLGELNSTRFFCPVCGMTAADVPHPCVAPVRVNRDHARACRVIALVVGVGTLLVAVGVWWANKV